MLKLYNSLGTAYACLQLKSSKNFELKIECCFFGERLYKDLAFLDIFKKDKSEGFLLT